MNRIGYLLALSLAVWPGIPSPGVMAQDSPPTLVFPRAHTGRFDSILALATNPDSSWMATLGADHTVSIWDEAEDRFLANAPVGPQVAMAVLPHGHRIVLGDKDGNLRAIDVDQFTELATGKVSGLLEKLFSTSDNRLFALTSTGLFRIDPETLMPTALFTSKSNGEYPYKAEFDEEGDAVAVLFSNMGEKVDHHVGVYRLTDGSLIAEKRFERLDSFTVRGNLLAAGTQESDNLGKFASHITVISLPGGEQKSSFAIGQYPSALHFTSSFGSGRHPALVVSYGGGIRALNVETGATLAEASINVISQELSEVNGQLIGAGTGVPFFCRLDTFHCIEPQAIHYASATQARMLPDRSLLLLIGEGRAIRIGETVVVEDLKTYGPALGLIPQYRGTPGLFAISGGQEGLPSIFVNNAIDPATYADNVPVSGTVPLAVSADGHYLAARQSQNADDWTVLLYDISVAPGKNSFEDLPVLAKWHLPTDNDNGDRYGFTFTPDGQTLVALNQLKGDVQRFNVSRREEMAPLRPPARRDPQVLGGEFITAWSMPQSGQRMMIGEDKQVLAIPLTSGSSAAIADLPASIHSLTAGAGDEVFMVLESGELMRWAGVGAPQHVAQLGFPCSSILYVPQRNWLIANSEGGPIHVLDASTGQEKMSLAFFADGSNWLLWTPDFQFDASDYGWQQVRWKFAPATFSPSEPVEDFRDDFYTPGLGAMAIAGDPPKAPALRIKERRTPTLTLVSSSPSKDGKVDLQITLNSPAGVKIRDVHLARDGVLLKTWAGDQKAGTQLSFSTEVVAGSNRFAAYAFNQDNVKSTDAVAEVTGPDSLKRAGDLYIVAIGINDYRNHAFRLNYARQDALLAAAALKAQRDQLSGFWSQLQQPENRTKSSSSDGDTLLRSGGQAHVLTLVDQDASKAGIMNALKDVSHRARAEDAIILYYGGHGIAVGDRYYLLPQDFAFDGPPSELRQRGASALDSTAISDREIESALEGEHAGIAALILDACQSGEVIGDNAVARRGPMNSRGLAQMAYDKRMYILAAALSTQSAAEQASLEHGVLTYALVEEGLIQDLASPVNLAGPGQTTLSHWLNWGVNRVVTSSGAAMAARGISPVDDEVSHKVHVQQPRLFSPPASDADILVASGAIQLDPATLTTAGFTTAPEPARPEPAAAVRTTILHPASTTPYLKTAAFLDEDHLAGGGPDGVVRIDLVHGAVESGAEESAGINLGIINMDASPEGDLLMLDQRGSVFLHAGSNLKQLVNGSGYLTAGTVKWIGKTRTFVLVNHDAITIYGEDGSKIRALARAPASAAAIAEQGDWLYASDPSNDVLSFQLPSLTPGPVWRGQPLTPGSPLRFITAIAVDPLSRRILRIMNTNEVEQAALPSLAADGEPLLHAPKIHAAVFSHDGAHLFIAPMDGSIQEIDAASGRELKTWPARVPQVESMCVSADDRTLVALGLGGLTTWSLPDGALRSEIPGGDYYIALHLDGSGKLNVLLNSAGKMRSFELPRPGETGHTDATGTPVWFPNKIVTRTADGVRLYSRDVSQSLSIPLAGKGNLNITPDGHWLAWLPEGDRALLTIYDTSTGRVVRTIRPASTPEQFALAPDGSAIYYHSGEQLHRVQLPKGTDTAAPLPNVPAWMMNISSDGGDVVFSFQGTLTLYNWSTQRVRRSIQLPYMVTIAQFVPGTAKVILGLDGGGILLWDPATTAEPASIGSIADAPVAFAFTPGADKLAAINGMGQFALFALDSAPHLLFTSTWVESAETWLTVGGDGHFTVTGDSRLPLSLSDQPTKTWTPAAQLKGFAPNLLDEILVH